MRECRRCGSQVTDEHRVHECVRRRPPLVVPTTPKEQADISATIRKVYGITEPPGEQHV